MIGRDEEKKPPAGRLAKAARERLLFVAVLAIGTIVWIGFQRHNNDETGICEDVFWATKAHWRNCADVVVAGDSRTYQGVSPQAMSSCLGEQRILNFGFGGAGYSDEYMQVMEGVLDAASRRKMILLGISPHSLTPRGAGNKYFKKNRARDVLKTEIAAFLFGRLNAHVRPVKLAAFMRSFLFRTDMHRYIQNFHSDGWAASARIPENQEGEIERYRQILTNNQVDASLVNGLLRRVALWRKAGIKVYGFRPPTTARMVALENEISGFDESSFVAAFRQAGGVWIHVDQTAYHSYDGSHLHYDAAKRLSQHLGRAIAAMEPKEARPLKPDAPPRKDPND